MSSKLYFISVILWMTNLGCASMKSFFALDQDPKKPAPIQNPFITDFSTAESKNNIVLRTKKGDRAVEVEFPGRNSEMTDFVVPVSPAFRENEIATDSSLTDERYLQRKPSATDREITYDLSKTTAVNTAERQEIESSLGVVPAEDPTPIRDKSYLAAIDHIKQLYRAARYEVGLIEADELLRLYPTDATLYIMRGTLLDRIGKMDLAIKSWNQALHLNPKNLALRKFVERRSMLRKVASP